MQLHSKILIGMLAGVALGIAAGPNSWLLPRSGVELGPDAAVYRAPGGDAIEPLARGVARARVLSSRPGDPPWLELRWRLTAAQRLKLKAAGIAEVDALPKDAWCTGWVREAPPEVRRYAPLGLGLVQATEWIGRLFLALIKMVVVPLVFFSLVVGVASLGDFRRLGRIGGRTLVYFTLTTTASLIIGVTLANLIRPGQVISADDRAALLRSYSGEAGHTLARAAETPSLIDQLVAIVPTNPVTALAEGQMLQIIFFALMLGIALTSIDAQRARPVVELFERLNEAMIILVHLIMRLAPYGVAALLFKVVGSTGASVLLGLLAYTGVVLLGLAGVIGLIYQPVVRWGARLSFRGFIRAVRPALLLGFSTSSSSATLPVTMECAEENVGVSRQISSFVLPLGATVNMDGTALYQGVAAVFIAQVYGMGLSVADQAVIILSATLASVGAAGVPGAGMITLAMVLTAVGIPAEGLALVLGVDRLLDMFRSATNLFGDSTAAALMARLEGEQLRLGSIADADR